MDTMSVIISAGALGITVIGAVIGAVLWLNKREREIEERNNKREKEMNEHNDALFANLQHDIHEIKLGMANAQNAIMSDSDSIRREAGEMGAAIRAKVHELELFVRDNFVSKATFGEVISRIEKTIGRWDEKLDNVVSNSRRHTTKD